MRHHMPKLMAIKIKQVWYAVINECIYLFIYLFIYYKTHTHSTHKMKKVIKT